MTFRTRNLYYLRISEHAVLTVFVYLDERHLEWMSDQVLQHVLSDLRPRILPKLIAEAATTPAAAKKASVDTHRGDTYQFCYFLRRTEPHSVVIKTRNYVARTQKRMQTRAQPSPANEGSSATNDEFPSAPRANVQKKRKIRATSTSNDSPPSRSTKKQRPIDLDDLEMAQVEGPVLAQSGMRTEAEEVAVVDVDQDEEMLSPQHDTFDLPMDEEEEKPKPTLQLRYKGFGIYGQCLCVVVEPWPTVRSATRAPPELGGISNRKSTQKQSTSTVSATTSRAKTPLFLTDDNDIDQEVEPQQPNFVTSHWDDIEVMEDSDDNSEEGGMMAFSQALNLAGDNRPGAAEDEDEMEGAVLFGDADEARQL